MLPIAAATYLVLDLRRNQFAAGYLELSANGVRWRASSNLSLRIYVDEGTTTDVDVADLSFYRPSPKQAWRPIRSEYLANLPVGFERIAALFSCAAEARASIAATAISAWLKPMSDVTHGIQTLYLVEDTGAAQDVSQWPRPSTLQGSICVVPPKLGDVTGYALLSLKQAPQEAAPCWLGVDPNFDGGGRWRKYVWHNYHFDVSEEIAPPQGEQPGGWLSNTGGQDEGRQTWRTLADVERTGAALLAIVRGSVLYAQLRKDVQDARKRRDKAQNVLAALGELERRLKARVSEISEELPLAAGNAVSSV
jgi:hypothetical protein